MLMTLTALEDRRNDRIVETPQRGTTGPRDRAGTVENMCNYIKQNLSGDLSLSTLENHFGMSRYTIQKMFKEVMGISPRKYVEECRISLLKRNLRNGTPVPEAIYQTGYNSQSWLYEKSSALLGMKPASYRKGGEGTEIKYLTERCSLGILMVAETDFGICSLTIGDTEEDVEKSLAREFPKAELIRSDSVRKRVEAILGFFEGQIVNLPLDIGGTEFQRRVWSTLITIPYGETRSYNDVAIKIGMPMAYRAVARACATNPVPLIVPCHRVVRKDGSIGGYALGVHRKEFLLKLEKKNSGKGKTHE